MQPSLVITEANFGKPRHADAVLRLLDEHARSPEGGGEGLSTDARLHLSRELAQRPHAHGLIAWIDEIPAGLIVAFEGFSTSQCKPLLNLHDVIVTQAYRGQGLTERLLVAAENLARRLGCCKVTLEVLEGKSVAIAAYHTAGFAPHQLDPAMGRAMFWEKKLS